MPTDGIFQQESSSEFQDLYSVVPQGSLLNP